MWIDLHCLPMHFVSHLAPCSRKRGLSIIRVCALVLEVRMAAFPEMTYVTLGWRRGYQDSSGKSTSP